MVLLDVPTVAPPPLLFGEEILKVNLFAMLVDYS
jgi:hypothetical protein